MRYLIGLDSDPGEAGAVTVIGYNAKTLPINGVGYVNCRQEEGGRKPGVDYIDPPDDIEQEYGEPAFVFDTLDFWANLEPQIAKWKRLGATAVEIDNLDTYDVASALKIFARLSGLNVWVKNAAIVEGDKKLLLAHPASVGCIVEEDCGTPAEYETLRKSANKPDTPIRFVSYGDGRGWAEDVANKIKAAKYQNMAVTYSARGEYTSVEHILLPTTGQVKPMPESNAPWAATLRSDVGRYHDGPDVPMLAQQVARAFPDDAAMASYCAMAGQGTAWCGIYAAYKLSRYGIKPLRKDNGVGGFMYVDAWLPFGTSIQFSDRKPGDLALWVNSGGLHHISFVGPDTSKYIGGNQSNGVTETTFPQPSHLRRPPPPVTVEPQPEAMPMLMIDSNGDAVRYLQTLLGGGLEVDGEFGPDTEAAVIAYQSIHSLEVDGIVGPETWASLMSGPQPPPPDPNEFLLTPDEIGDIMQLAADSAIARYSWKDRGKAPLGYTKGMAVMYAQCWRKLQGNDSAVLAMTQPIGASGKDALAYYTISATGRDAVLRKLFVMLYGLGMRESSGNYTEGRDMSASNVTADTAEAGLFQQSWNSSAADTEMKKLLPAYQDNKQPCYSNIFKEGVELKSTTSYGTGPGREYQDLAKSCPAFATEMCGVGLRVLYNHWGPVVRQEVEMRAEADALLIKVAAYLKDVPIPGPEPEPEPEPITEVGKAKKRAMDSIEDAVDRLIADMAKITQTSTGSQSSGVLQSVIPMIPTAVTDSLLRFAWPYIARLSADEVIEIKNKITAGEFGIDDLLAIVGSSGIPLLLTDVQSLAQTTKRKE
jgi:peptidoglycan hydrolase-like protein with peptidoglycan-binding domain